MQKYQEFKKNSGTQIKSKYNIYQFQAEFELSLNPAINKVKRTGFFSDFFIRNMFLS